MIRYITDLVLRRRPDGECARPGCREHGPYNGRCADDQTI